MTADVAAQSIGEFHRQIADPEVFSGGGSVAAVAAAGAASTALLVMRLNLRRRSNAPIRSEIEQAISTTQAAMEQFHKAADADIAILDELLEAQRASRASGDRRPYLTALTRAAESPLSMGELIASLLETIASQLPISTRFTVSDLGAAAVLAEGACRAALLTAEVNIALLREAEDADQDVVNELEQRRGEIRTRVVEQSVMIEGVTRAQMLKESVQPQKGQA